MDIKSIFSYLGVDADKIKSIDEFKTEFENEFLRKSTLGERKDLIDPIVNNAFSKRLNSIETGLKRVAKEYAVDLTEDELKDKKIEDVVRTVVGKAFETSNTLNEELKEKLAKTGDSAVKEWQTKYEKLEKKYLDADSLLKTTSKQFDDFKLDSTNKFKSFQVEYSKKDLFSKLKFKPTVTEIEKEGFNSVINKKYQFDIDEQEGLIVRLADGKRVPSETVTGKFKSAYEVLEEEAIKNNLFELNNNKKPAFSIKAGNQNSNNNGSNNGNPAIKRTAHPSLLK